MIQWLYEQLNDIAFGVFWIKAKQQNPRTRFRHLLQSQTEERRRRDWWYWWSFLLLLNSQRHRVFEEVASNPFKAIHMLLQHSSHTVLTACAHAEFCEIGKNIFPASSFPRQAWTCSPPVDVVELSKETWPCVCFPVGSIPRACEGLAIFCCLTSRGRDSRRHPQLLFRPVNNNILSGFYLHHVWGFKSLCGTTLGCKCMKTLLTTDKIHTHSVKHGCKLKRAGIPPIQK